jgi:hypothetical protein
MNFLIEFVDLESAHKHLLLSRRTHQLFEKRMWKHLKIVIDCDHFSFHLDDEPYGLRGREEKRFEN